MNIGFDASRTSVNQRTGTENYSYQLLLNIAQIDHTNNYYIYLRPGSHIKAVQSILSPFKNFKLCILNFKFLWTQFGLAKQTFLDHLDLLFIPSHTLPLIRKPGLKTILTVHDLGAEFLPQTHQFKQRLYLKLITDYQLKSASHLIAVSQATKNDLINKIGIPEKNISVIYEGYNEKLFKHDVKDSILKQYDLDKIVYFLFVGTIQPRKNLERLIKAYASFIEDSKINSPINPPSSTIKNPSSTLHHPSSNNNIPLLVLVGGKGWLSDEIYTLPKKLGIEKYVKLLGYVPDENLPTLYSKAQAFVFPSLFEGFGLPLLEAMACGCAIITSNLSSMPEIAGKAALLVNPYDQNEIFQALRDLSTNSPLKEKLIKEGFQQVKKYSWQKCAQETIAVFKELVI